MKQLILISTLFFLCLSSCKNAKEVNVSIDQVNIIIEQNGMAVMPSNGVHRLDRKEFNVVLELPKPMGLLVNASFSNQIAAEGKPLAIRQEFQKENIMAVSLFNEERTVYISEDSSSPWYYENEKDNNFNNIQTLNDRYRCTRTIKYFQENTSAKSNIEKITAPLFLTIVPEVVFEVNPDSVEVLGKYLKIEWNGTTPEMAADARANDDLQSLDSAYLEEIKAENAQLAAMDLAEANRSQFSPLVQNVISQLEIDESGVDAEFVSSRICPDNPEESIVFIPVIVEEDEDFFRLSTYIVIAETETGNLINIYFEPYSIESDAVLLTNVSIDTAPYYVAEDNRAFGIKVSHHSMSQPNPYSTSVLSLYLESENKITRILKDYTVSEYSGEWDTRCAGEFIHQEKTVQMSSNQTNGFYDIKVKDTITNILSFVGGNGDCDEEKDITILEHVIKYNGEEYTLNGEFSLLEVYLFNADENDTKIRNAPDGDAIFHFNGESDYQLVITEMKDGWSKVVEVIEVDADPVSIPGGEGWIKNKYFTAGVRKTIELIDAPEHGIGVGEIELETKVQIVDKYRDWVLVESEGISGWIEIEWLCGNPYTTCP